MQLHATTHHLQLYFIIFITSYNLLTYYGVFIHVMYIRVLQTTLRVYYIHFIKVY
jgi:hypothetical protein